MTSDPSIEIDPDHPALTQDIIGQDAAVADAAQALTGDHLHHAWLFSGPRGIGKATLAWRMAHAILTRPEDTGAGLFGDAMPAVDPMAPPMDSPVLRRMMLGGEARFFHLTRSVDEKTGRLRAQITVDDVRKLKSFFGLSAADGGWRVVLVDAADDMNISAANAILKLLEEPPARAVLILLAHSPAKLLPTIRSRCRVLRMLPLGADDMARALHQNGIEAATDDPRLTELAGGSVGTALSLLQQDGMGLFQDMIDLISTMPRLARHKALAMADKLGARGQEAQLDLFFMLLDVILTRLARTGAMGAPPPGTSQDEAEMLMRLAPHPAAARRWADLAQEIGNRATHARAVNLDPAALILDTLWKMQGAARPS